MAQGVLPFQYREEQTASGMTALAGLPLYLELAHVAGLPDAIRRHVRMAGHQGWDDVQVVVALLLLHLAGGSAVEDVCLLEADPGLCTVLRRVEGYGLNRRQRRARGQRWRRLRRRTVPSPSAVLRYLERFHDRTPEPSRQGQATIPALTPGLRGLVRVNGSFVAWVQRCRPQTRATLDQDARSWRAISGMPSAATRATQATSR